MLWFTLPLAEFHREIRQHLARNFKHRCICNSFAAVFVLKFNSTSGYSFANCGRDFGAQTEVSRLKMPLALKFDLI